MNFWSDWSENSYQPQDILANFNFFIIRVNHNEQYNDRWKLSVNLKLIIFTIPCSNNKTSFCKKSLNFQSFSKFQKGAVCRYGGTRDDCLSSGIYGVGKAYVETISCNTWTFTQISRLGCCKVRSVLDDLLSMRLDLAEGKWVLALIWTN
jgi:hypothetical protein